MNFMIHACPQRMWYVEEFLIPSITTQGIPRVDIQVWLDENKRGNLLSCVDSFKSLGGKPGGTWHLQDDVIISRDFFDKAASNNDGVVCGFFCENFSNPNKPGMQCPEDMWCSFPCIHIPNQLAAEFANWFWDTARHTHKYYHYIKERKHDDYLWREFMVTYHGKMEILNLAPNIVDHMDFLIGGSVVNNTKSSMSTRSSFWDDDRLVEELRIQIAARNT